VATVADVVTVSRVRLHPSELEPTREDVEDASHLRLRQTYCSVVLKHCIVSIFHCT